MKRRNIDAEAWGWSAERITLAIDNLKRARDYLSCAGARQACAAARRALKSAEGARRHAERMQGASEQAAERRAGMVDSDEVSGAAQLRESCAKGES